MRAWILLALVSTASLARAEAAGSGYHGAGGPFLSAVGLFATGAPGPQVLFTSGGYGYTYFLEGRLRLGGGGQGTLTSSEAGGQTGSMGWGSLHVGWDPLASGDWEFPLALSVGGGRMTQERVEASGLISRDSHAFFCLQVSASVEYRVVRTVKLALMFSYLTGLNAGGLQLQAAEGSLRLVFMLPRVGF
jgi:hypothetical protein